MRKTIIVMLSIVASFLSEPFVSSAVEKDFEKYYVDIGYTDIATALIDGQKHFKTDISLPSKLPGISFTHAFGRLNDLDGEVDDELEFEFLNAKKDQNHFKILIKPVQYKEKFEEKNIKQKIKMNNGSEAIYSKSLTGFDTLVFEKNNLQYILIMDDSSNLKSSIDSLVEIANSVK
ncbi:hypothetical protein [Rummeliibacillus suwonensis]|uniref:hypothetical protein n=1 Tax=Rummeliibacillus suwonensis TaxID=1306154 RepID=UPI0011B6D964|nr:hypothetical protein [Rummeliibacillus suwonensis]